jgi:hypothetical protein
MFFSQLLSINLAPLTLAPYTFFWLELQDLFSTGLITVLTCRAYLQPRRASHFQTAVVFTGGIRK